ncbi:MAG: Inositol-phosphate phosphatase [Thermoleophilia bacterium]|nr:Inositol-phosphate phosphatase [Thermoleophilia bacterium]
MTEPTATARRADCERIALEAAALLRSRFGNPGEIHGKGTPDDLERLYDVVTEVDFASERLILDRIAELNPDAVVLAEEGGLTAADGTRTDDDPSRADEVWLVDPLDGTINFAHGVPHFCVSVACWRSGEPFAGAIVDPMVGETFSFERHDAQTSSAFHDGTRLDLGEGPQPAHSLLYVGGGGPSLNTLKREFRSWRRLGSAALALAWVGAGRCGAYVQPGLLHPWDWGVGVPFIQAAGGTVTDGGGQGWSGRLHGTTGIVAAPRSIHAKIAELAAAASASG